MQDECNESCLAKGDESCAEAMDPRVMYVRRLMAAGVKVDAYGKCLHNKDLPPGKTFSSILRQYKFQLVLEPVVCADYYSDRLWASYDNGVVPIVFGWPELARFTPRASAMIHVSKFPSPEALAAFVLKAASDKAMFDKFLLFKTQKAVSKKFADAWSKPASWEKVYCKICKKYDHDAHLPTIPNGVDPDLSCTEVASPQIDIRRLHKATKHSQGNKIEPTRTPLVIQTPNSLRAPAPLSSTQQRIAGIAAAEEKEDALPPGVATPDADFEDGNFAVRTIPNGQDADHRIFAQGDLRSKFEHDTYLDSDQDFNEPGIKPEVAKALKEAFELPADALTGNEQQDESKIDGASAQAMKGIAAEASGGVVTDSSERGKNDLSFIGHEEDAAEDDIDPKVRDALNKAFTPLSSNEAALEKARQFEGRSAEFKVIQPTNKQLAFVGHEKEAARNDISPKVQKQLHDAFKKETIMGETFGTDD
jgi:hypothetical protein